jgi:hypothetical protein
VLIKFRTETRHENFVSLLICFMDINYRWYFRSPAISEW